MAIIHVLRPSLFSYILLIVMCKMVSSIPDSEALLRLKKSITNAEPLSSWQPGSQPCADDKQWVGIVCYNGAVNGIRLGEMGLSGKIDTDALMQIPGLRSLSFVNNSFSGPIPEFNRMGALKAIYLSGNQFSGEIPSNYFTTMESMKKVWLSENKFIGEIPSSLSQLPNLIELHLENNQFSGAVPPLKQPTLMALNLSYNNLEGQIPVSLSRFNASSFEGNAGICGEKLGKTCDDPRGKSPVPNNNMNSSTAEPNRKDSMIGYLLLGVAAFLLLLMIMGVFLMKKRQERLDLTVDGNLDESIRLRVSNSSIKDMDSIKKNMSSSRRGSTHGKSIGDLVLVNDEKGEFGLSDLMKAAAEVLGNGALGSSYKAMMSDGFTVVVKRMKYIKMGKDGFDAEIRRLGRLRHRNILTPLAYHYRKDEKLLVYEFIPKGSLLYLLHGDRGPSHAELNWPTRLKIVHGIARGLGYLHTELALFDLPHGDLKSCNVLLTPNNEPLLADYGFSSLINPTQGAQTLAAYRSPEAIQRQQVSPKCDVYCLGIIILEILTGKFPSQYLNNDKGGIDVVQWVKLAISEGREAELFDPEIASSRNSLGEMERLLHIGAACIESNPEQRLEIGEAIRRIAEIENGQEGRTFHVLPSLRDGYAETSRSLSQMSNVQENYGELSRRRHDGYGDRSGRRNGDSFAFDIS